MAEDSNSFKLTLEGNGISVCKDIGEEKARRILNILLGPSSVMVAPAERHRNVRARPAHEESTSKEPMTVIHSTSIREHLDEVQAKRNPDKILAMAAYLVETTGYEDFSAEEIKDCFPKAAEKIPANFTRDFRWVVSSGWIAENHQAVGRYYVTKTGRKALAEKFPKELTKPQPGYAKRKKKQQNNIKE